ncbi:hypothetical protein PRVXT_001730 [Proteinivorax tanatarense]|uniref:Uncharacterized protein n=1 Tax=Proteinivorax tanatarense TaxID=1260629 RepID=A0AAU7VIB1_9FIRM
MEILIFIIIVIISVVLKSNNQIEQEKQKRKAEKELQKHGVPVHKHYTDHGEDYSGSFREENKQQESIDPGTSPREVEMYEQTNNHYKQQQEKLQKTKEKTKKLKSKENLGASIGETIKENEIGTSHNTLFTDRKQLVNGIIMSEVLSKPKYRR